jgi:signal peptidase I
VSKKPTETVAGKKPASQPSAQQQQQHAAKRPVEQPAEKSTLREYVEAFGMAILLALFIRTFLVQAFKIPSGSMLPTLQIGDHLLVNKLLYGLRIPILEKRVLQVYQPEHDDVVVFRFPEDRDKDFIKRVKAVGGETIEIKNKVVHVNGEAIDDPYAFIAPNSPVFPSCAVRRGSQCERDNFGPVTVPEGHVFVMGDNRDHSHDSRFWGTVPVDDILGKAFILYWSWDSEAFRPRLSRLGNPIH